MASNLMRALMGMGRCSHTPWLWAFSPQSRPFSMRQAVVWTSYQLGPSGLARGAAEATRATPKLDADALAPGRGWPLALRPGVLDAEAAGTVFGRSKLSSNTVLRTFGAWRVVATGAEVVLDPDPASLGVLLPAGTHAGATAARQSDKRAALPRLEKDETRHGLAMR